jgi:mono/diheme cytochrome c family protein
MSKTIRNYAALAVVVLMTGVMGFAQAGEATYKAKCQSCHGADGIPNPGIAKMMGVKPASDATVKAHSLDEMIATTTNGKNKMPAFKGKLSDDEIKTSVEYFRTFAK